MRTRVSIITILLLGCLFSATYSQVAPGIKGYRFTIDDQTEPWGIKVSVVEVKDVELPQTMQRAMARQAEAEREKRAKIIHAEGEYQAAQQLAEAAGTMAKEPATLQLRYLQTLTEIAVEKNSTIIFPVPIDIITAFMSMAQAFSKRNE